MFTLTEVSFSIHQGLQSLIIANNVIVVWHGVIYTSLSFFFLSDKILVALREGRTVIFVFTSSSS